MKKLSRIIAGLSTAAVMAVSAVSFSGSAAQSTIYNDPSGDGIIDISDAIAIKQYLAGGINPKNVDALDFDNNGVISQMDAYKIQLYLAKFLNIKNSQIDKNTEAETTFANESPISYRVYNAATRSYLRSYKLSEPTEYSNENAGISTYSVMPDDDRYVDWSKSGTVKLMNSTNYMGTGFVVAPHVIATCAHCVYGSSGIYSISGIKLFNTDGSLSLTATPKEIHIPTKYYNSSEYEPHYDYALITVKEDLSDYMCYDLGVALDSSFSDENKRNDLPIYITGFAQESNAGGNGHISDNMITGVGKLYTKEGHGNNLLPYQILCDTASTNGDSGGPVYVKEYYTDDKGNNNTCYTVIGISSSGAWRYSAATRITTDLLVFYQKNNNLKWE